MAEAYVPWTPSPSAKDECQKLKLPDKTKHSLKAHCWNEADGCQFVGNIQDVVLHFDRECAFHALQCPTLRTKNTTHRHCRALCFRGAARMLPCASSGQSKQAR
ncbi:hypothetical protein MTO96_036885 [Rhipicephalus appendiculatus]